MGLEATDTTDAGLSLAVEERLEAGREEDEGEKVLAKLGGVLDFSVSHVGVSLEDV